MLPPRRGRGRPRRPGPWLSSSSASSSAPGSCQFTEAKSGSSVHASTARDRGVGVGQRPVARSSPPAAGREPHGAPPTPPRRRRRAPASRRRRRSWDACARLGARPVRGERLGGQLIRRDRQIRVLVGSASAVDARLARRSWRAYPIFQRRQPQSSEPAGAQLVQPSAIPLRRPARTPVADSDRNRLGGLGFGRSVEEARRRVGRTNPLLDHPHHLDHPRGLTDQCAHLVARRHRGGRLGGPAVHPHVPTPARVGGVGSGLDEPDRPQPPVHAGRLHAFHHGLGSRRSVAPTTRSLIVTLCMPYFS